MNKPRPYIIGETNWAHVRSVKYEVAVLPWGATEAHNYHLPYETDNIPVDLCTQKGVVVFNLSLIHI